MTDPSGEAPGAEGSPGGAGARDASTPRHDEARTAAGAGGAGDVGGAGGSGEVGDAGEIGSGVADRAPVTSERRSERPERGRKRPGRRRRLVVLLVVLGLSLAALAGGARWVQVQLDPPGAPGAEVAVTLEEGWGVSRIADELARLDVIGSSLVFQVYVRLSGSGPFQAGDYTLRHDLGVKDAVDALEVGPTIAYQELRVPPGLRLVEIARRVEEQLPGLTAERFLEVAASGKVRSKYQPRGVRSLEGLLWPDTYRFVKSDNERDVLRTMVKELDRRASRLGIGTAANGLSPYETLIVASLVQSEAKVDEDRPLIASVVMNRLAQDMPLQIDATVLYAIGERKASNTAADRATESPYNTYLVRGLPPTPISGVAAVSIDAALNPAVSSYLYYVVADEEGHHAFAETYEEHLANVEAAREKGLIG